MKRKILLWLFVNIFFIPTIFAATVNNFEVTLTPNKAKVWEAMDLKIKAVDKNNSIIEDYEGTVLIFSETNPEAELPITLTDGTYKFVPADRWEVVFENGVKFTKSGQQKLNVFDFIDDTIFGITGVTITEEWGVKTEAIDIISPENWLTLWKESIKVSGSSKKNHKVKVIVNETDEYDTTTNESGIYEVEVKNLQNGSNSIQAKVFDGEEHVIWESKKISVKIATNGINLKKVKVLPEEVYPEAAYEIEVIANKWLKKVSALINDSVIELNEVEWEDGNYKAKSYAPKEVGSYNVDIELSDDLGHESKELGQATLTVKELSAPLEEEKKEQKPEPKKEEPKVEAPKENDPMKITGIKLVELKTKSILTWDRVKSANGYNIYKKLPDGELELIKKVNTERFEVEITGEEIKYDYFAIKAVWETEEGKEYEWDLSEATKVKTWPELVILLLISLFFAWLFLMLARKKA